MRVNDLFDEISVDLLGNIQKATPPPTMPKMNANANNFIFSDFFMDCNFVNDFLSFLCR